MMKAIKLSIILLLLLPVAAISSPVIDGVISIDERNNSTEFSGFLITKPLTMLSPIYDTKVFMSSYDEGIYIAFVNQSNTNTTVQKTTSRDEDLRADYNEVIIDFDGSGGRAYGFKIGRSSSIQDSVWSSDAREKTDWDGAWEYAVAEIDDGWVSELYIPWSIAVRAESLHTADVIKLYFSRWDNTAQQRTAFPAIDRVNQRFLTNFHRVDVKRKNESALDIFPYIRSSYSLVDNRSEEKTGIDVFWKPSASQQLNITINPDFGQVESDELVVNFSAIETFLSEKRPFYSENHDLFDLQGPETLRLVHTPRIGGEPNTGDADASEIDYAARYVAVGTQWDYGLLLSQEADEDEYDGRSFNAARLQYKFNSGKVGLLQTIVDDTAIQREAYVSAIDFENKFSGKLAISGQLMYSRISNSSDQQNTSDFAFWLTGQYNPIDAWHNEMTFFEYGSDFDVNDFGFVKRVNRRQLEIESEYEWADFAAGSYVKEFSTTFEMEYKENEQDDKLPLQLAMSINLLTIYATEFELAVEQLTAGKDDLLTRGNYSVDLSSAYAVAGEYHSSEDERLQYDIGLEFGTQGFDKRFSSIEFTPSYQIGENFNIAFEFAYNQVHSWLIWEKDNDITEFKKKEFSIAINSIAVIGEKHELRLKLESVALKSFYENSYLVYRNGNAISFQNKDDDFSLGEFAFQLRYRYQLGPQSEVYLVYSRGGEIEEVLENFSYADLILDAIEQPAIESFLIKVRFHL